VTATTHEGRWALRWTTALTTDGFLQGQPRHIRATLPHAVIAETHNTSKRTLARPPYLPVTWASSHQRAQTEGQPQLRHRNPAVQFAATSNRGRECVWSCAGGAWAPKAQTLLLQRGSLKERHRHTRARAPPGYHTNRTRTETQLHQHRPNKQITTGCTRRVIRTSVRVGARGGGYSGHHVPRGASQVQPELPREVH
jgi:hypothetical protein